MPSYHKLVRDRIPEIIQKKGEHARFHTATDEEYWIKLKEKLHEEVDEVCTEINLAEELADVLEVIDAICTYKHLDREEIVRLQKEKQEKRGGFQQRLILEETS